MQEPCQEQEMYQRDNRQKEVRKRRKETTEGERQAGRGWERETEEDRGRGHLEATGGGLRPRTALFHTHTQMSFLKYVLGVYVERWTYVLLWVCTFMGVCLMGSLIQETVWHTWVWRLQDLWDGRREQNSPGDINVQQIMSHRQPSSRHGRTLQTCVFVCACVCACVCAHACVCVREIDN